MAVNYDKGNRGKAKPKAKPKRGKAQGMFIAMDANARAADARRAKTSPSNPYGFNDSTGSVGAPGSYARAGVAENLLGPFNEIPKAAPAPPPDTGAHDYWAAVAAANQPDPMKALLDELMGSIHTDVGAGPNLNDYIGAFGPARQNALDYQTAATGKINAGTADLLAKLNATSASNTKFNADAGVAAKGATDKVAADQAAAAAKAAGDLKAQGVSTAPVDAAALATSGELAANTANQDAFAAKLAAAQATEGADRVNSANTMNAGALGTLGLNTNATLGRLNEGEAAARVKFGQDSASHSAAASNAASNDVERRIALAKEFAGLDAGTEEDPTASVKASNPQYGTMWGHLESGMTPSEVRLDLEQGIAAEQAKASAERNTAKVASAKGALKALDEWEKATAPDKKAEAKKRQVELLRHYLGGPSGSK